MESLTEALYDVVGAGFKLSEEDAELILEEYGDELDSEVTVRLQEFLEGDRRGIVSLPREEVTLTPEESRELLNRVDFEEIDAREKLREAVESNEEVSVTVGFGETKPLHSIIRRLEHSEGAEQQRA